MRVVRYHIAGLLHSPRFPRDWVVMILFYFLKLRASFSSILDRAIHLVRLGIIWSRL